MTKHREDLHFNEENINTHHSTFTIFRRMQYRQFYRT